MLKVLVGGRVAEELVFGEDQVTTGASNDFEKATGIAKKMVYEFGMSPAGLAVYKDQGDFWGRSTGTDASPSTKERMEKEVEIILAKAVFEVKELLTINKAKLDSLASALLLKET